MKQSRICFRIVILFLLVIALFEFISLSKHEFFPYASLQYKVDSLYLIKGDSFYQYYSTGSGDYLFTIPEYEQDALICVDSVNKVFRYGYNDVYKQIASSAFLVSFNPDDIDMARSISAHTDNLATHDCLYVCSLQRASVINAISALKDNTKGFFYRGRQYIVIFCKNLVQRCRYLFHRKSFTLDAITVSHKPVYYQYYYISSVTGQAYLFEQIPSCEKEWGLYYYPTVLLSGPLLDNIERVWSNSDGILYKCINSISYDKSTYHYSKDGNYIRTVGKRDKYQPFLCSYYSDVEDANALIQDFFYKSYE